MQTAVQEKTWDERYQEGQGITVGRLKVGDIFRVDNRIGTILSVDSGRVRVSYRVQPKPRDVLMHDDEGKARVVTINTGSADVANIAPTTQVDEILGKEEIVMGKIKKNGNGKKVARTERPLKGGWTDAKLPDKFTRVFKGTKYALARGKDGWSINGKGTHSIREAMIWILSQHGNPTGRTADNFFRTIEVTNGNKKGENGGSKKKKTAKATA